MQLLENSRDPELFKTDYMQVILSYFEQFSTKVTNENKTITPEVTIEIQLYYVYICLQYNKIILSFNYALLFPSTAVRDYAESC